MVKINFDDDPAFRSLSNNKDIRLKRLSWQCSQLMCSECDGFIHYKFKKVYDETIDAKTGEVKQKIKEVEWDTEFESVQLDGGATQNRFNTPEGSRCECHHCHGRKGYDEWKKRGGKPIGNLRIEGQTKGYKKKELSEEERESLK